MMTSKLTWLCLLILMALTGCDGLFGPDCYDATLVERIAIGLFVQDSVTGTSPFGVTATIQRAVGRAFTSSSGIDAGGRGVQFAFGLGAGPGTYTVSVMAPGFQPWLRTGLRVPADECGRIRTIVSLTALLQRSAAAISE